MDAAPAGRCVDPMPRAEQRMKLLPARKSSRYAGQAEVCAAIHIFSNSGPANPHFFKNLHTLWIFQNNNTTSGYFQGLSHR
jgi:hypothetical protein